MTARRLPVRRVALLSVLAAIAVTVWTYPALREWRLRAAPLGALLESVRHNPEDVRARCELASRLEALGLNAHAAAAYAEVVRSEENGRVWEGLARSLAALGRRAEAKAALRQYTRRNPGDAAAQNDLARLTAGQTLAVPTSAFAPMERLLGDANALRLGKNKSDALCAYETLLRRDDRNAAAWFGAGATLDALHRPAEAFAAYDRAVTLVPTNAAWQRLLAERAFQAGLMRDAARRFRLVTKSDPTDHEAWYQLGVILVSSRAFSTEARDAFAAAVRLAPQNARYRVELAETYAALNDEEAAEHEFREALRLAPDDLEIAGRMGVYLAGRDDTARRGEGRRLLEKAAAAAPQHELFPQELARLCLADGDAARAIALLEPLTHRPKNPGQVNTFYVLSQAYKRQGDLGRAQAALSRSRAVRAYYDAALAVRESAERRPRDAALRLRLARLHREAGEDAKALDQYRAAERFATTAAPIRRERENYEASLSSQKRLPDMTLFSAMVERSAP